MSTPSGKAADGARRYFAIVGTPCNTFTAVTVLFVEEEHSSRVLEALESVEEDYHLEGTGHKWKLVKEQVDDHHALPSSLGYHVIQSVPDELPNNISEPDLLELLVKGKICETKYLVVEISDGKRWYQNSELCALKVVDEKHLEPAKELLESMEECEELLYVRSVWVVSHAEFLVGRRYDYHSELDAKLFERLKRDIKKDDQNGFLASLRRSK